MTDQEIKEEAKRRFDSMSAEEKLAAWGPDLTQDDIAFVHHVEEVGFKQLPSEEQRRFGRMMTHASNGSLAGGMLEYGLMQHAAEQFHITREDIANGAKNPYKKVCWIIAICGLALAMIGGVLAVVGSRNDLRWLTSSGIGFEVVTGLLAMKFADSVSSVFRFKKLQKKCMNGEMDEELIRQEVVTLAMKEGHDVWYR